MRYLSSDGEAFASWEYPGLKSVSRETRGIIAAHPIMRKINAGHSVTDTVKRLRYWRDESGRLRREAAGDGHP